MDALTVSMFCGVTAVRGIPVDLPLMTDPVVQNAVTQRNIVLRSGISHVGLHQNVVKTAVAE